MRKGTLWIAFALILGACGDETVRPDRDGQTPAPKATGGTGGGDSSGGSGGTAGTSAAGQSGSAGVGGAGGSTTIPLPNCDALCIWGVEVSGDCPADATEKCLAAFQSVAATQGPTCLANLETWCLCLRNNSDASQVSCTEGPVTANTPVITGEVPACNAEKEAWSACL